MNYGTPILRNKKFWYIIFGFILIIILYEVFSYFRYTNITVTSTNINSLSIYSISDSGAQTLVNSGALKITAKVTPGKYELIANNQLSSASRYVTVKAHHSITVNLKTSGLRYPQYVLPYGALGLTANSSSITYLDFDTNNLYTLNGSGIVNSIFPSISFSSFEWANNGFGVGQSSNGTLYSLNNGSLNQIILPKNGSNISYSLNQNGYLYVSIDNFIYGGQFGTNLKQLFKTNSDEPKLFAGNNALAIIDPINEYNNNLRILKNNVVTSKKLNIAGVSWSPDGKELITSGGESTTTLYTSNLTKINTLPNNISGISWISDSSFVYGQSRSVWMYNLTTNNAIVISQVEANEQVTSTYESVDNNYLYVVVESSSSTNAHSIYRINISNNPASIPVYNYTLGIFLPNTNDQCSFTYSNLNKTYVIINGWSDQTYCEGSAQALLQTYDVPLSDVNIIFNQTNIFND